MPYHDIQQIHSVGAHTVGGKMNPGTQRTRTFVRLLNLLHLSRCEHGVICARGKLERQGAGDGSQTDSVAR